MYPFVPSGSRLELEAVAPGTIEIGDIVAYAGARPAAVVAHRVVRIQQEPREIQGQPASTRVSYVVRGDAQTVEEQIPAIAIAYRVSCVHYAGFSYDTRGPLGRVFARLALRRGPGQRAARQLADVARRLRWLRAIARRFEQQARPPDTSSRKGSNGAPARPEIIELASSKPSFAPGTELDPRDSLLRGLKHELRTPLNAILGFAEVLLGELDGPLSSDARENVSVVREAGQKLLTLINEVLDLAAALVAQREPQFEETDLVVLLDEARAALEERRGVRPVYIRVDGTLDHLEAYVDKRAIARLARSLGEVALAAIGDGEIVLGATRIEDRLRLRIHVDGWQAPADALSESAVVGDRSKRLFRMRLLIARKLAERMGGQLGLETTPNGTSLVFESPGRDAQAPAAKGGASLDDVSVAIGYLAAMGHDLRTPLNAIVGFADLLSLSGQSPWSEPQQKSLAIIRERARDLATLVDDMIDWAKLEAGELALQCVEQPARPLIDRVLELATQRSGARGLCFDLDLPLDLGMIRVDGTRFVQALVGLLDHAVRSNPAPLVRVSARRTLDSGRDGSRATPMLRIEILDPGLEVREQDHAALFAAFRPSYAPTGQRIAGLQLGTSVARALLRAHGGDVWFESRPGRGTLFIATLPLGS